MGGSLDERIDEQDSWTFQECLGLAMEFNTKTRFVILKVMARGKRYIDGSRDATDPSQPGRRS